MCCPAAGGATAASSPSVIVFTLLVRVVAARPCAKLRILSVAHPGIARWHGHCADVRSAGWRLQSALCLRASHGRCVTLQGQKFKLKVSVPVRVLLEDGCLPYSKPSFPSPGGHNSGTGSSKGSTGPRKTEGPRQPQQWTATEHAEFLGTNGQGQYSGELCE